MCLSSAHFQLFLGGEDYVAVTQQPVYFAPGETVATFEVTILDDVWYETKEDFYIDVEIPPDAVTMGIFKGVPNTIKIEIENDGHDGKACIIYAFTPF